MKLKTSWLSWSINNVTFWHFTNENSIFNNKLNKLTSNKMRRMNDDAFSFNRMKASSSLSMRYWNASFSETKKRRKIRLSMNSMNFYWNMKLNGIFCLFAIFAQNFYITKCCCWFFFNFFFHFSKTMRCDAIRSERIYVENGYNLRLGEICLANYIMNIFLCLILPIQNRTREKRESQRDRERVKAKEPENQRALFHNSIRPIVICTMGTCILPLHCHCHLVLFLSCQSSNLNCNRYKMM